MTKLEGVSLFLNLIGVGITVWQIVKNSSLKRYIKTDAMELYSETGILLGNIQGWLIQLQNGNNNLAIQEAGKAEGLTQALIQHSVKNIQHHFNFNLKNLDEWIEKKKILENHRPLFLKYMTLLNLLVL